MLFQLDLAEGQCCRVAMAYASASASGHELQEHLASQLATKCRSR